MGRIGIKVKVLGMGNVGSTVAAHLISSDLPITHLYLWDEFRGILSGHEYDLRDMANVLKKTMTISKSYDIGDADIFILAVGLARKTSHEQQQFGANFMIVKECLKMCNPERPVIIVTNPYDKITERLNKEYPLRDFIGAGYKLDNSRKLAYSVDPERIAEYILDSKGCTAFGIAAEVLEIVRFLCYGKGRARYEHEAKIDARI